MSRIDQFTLDLGDGAPRLVSYDSKSAKPLDADGNPPPRRRKAEGVLKMPPSTFRTTVRPAKAVRDAAIEQVLENERRAWRELHDKELTAFLIEKGATAFLAEDFRRWFIARGHEAPHHPNVWGAVWMAAARQGHMAKTGRYLAPQDVHSHARLCTEWTKPTHDVREL